MALTVAPDFTDGILTPARLQQLSDAINERTPITARLNTDYPLAATSTTLEDVTDLVVIPEVGATYDVNGVFVYTANTTEDIKFAFTLPTDAVLDFFSIGLNAAATFTQILDVDLASGTALAYGGEGVGSPRMVYFKGTLVMSTTAGNLQVRAAQNTSGANISTVRAGSWIELRKTA